MAINKDAFKQVLAIVEKSARARKAKRAFNYSYWFQDADLNHDTIGDILEHPCGTSGCLGGWGAVLQFAKTAGGRKKARFALFGASGESAARRFFGINGVEANYLFYGVWSRRGIRAPDKDVIAKLKNIIKTGKVINEAFDRRYQ